MPVKIRLRRDLSSVWQLVNPLLLDGEPAFETDTGKMKIGDGEKTYNALPYTSGLKVEGLAEYLGKPNGIAPLNGDKTIPSEYLPAISVPGSIPKGVIVMWSGTLATIPVGWALCDGKNGTPDLRNKFIRGIGTGATDEAGATGGSDTITLDGNNLPAHAHNMVHSHTVSGTMSSVQAHEHSFKGMGGINYVPSFPSNQYSFFYGWSFEEIPTGYSAPSISTGGDMWRANSEVVAAGGHTHTISQFTEPTSTVGLGAEISIVPTYYALAFIIKT